MPKPACYGLMVLRHRFDSLEANGEFATARINRRALLFHTGSAVVASTVAATALGKEPPGQDPDPSTKLRTLIDEHKTAYSSFGEALHETGVGRIHSARASREEERALLAVCSYAAVGEGDRRARRTDLAEHMQAVLRSTMWKG